MTNLIFCYFFGQIQNLMPAEIVPKFYYITHLCKLEQNRKLIFFSFFKNKIEFCCLSTLPTWKIWSFEFLERGLKAAIVAYEHPSHSIKFCATSTWCTSKDHIFYVGKVFKQQNYTLFLKKLKKLNFLFCSISHRCVM